MNFLIRPDAETLLAQDDFKRLFAMFRIEAPTIDAQSRASAFSLRKFAARRLQRRATMIEKLVHAFYARVRCDELIGPIFAARISEWDHHLQRLCQFWSSVVLMSGRYHGSPMQKHLALPVEAAMPSRSRAATRSPPSTPCAIRARPIRRASPSNRS